jgi:hypothetical protein
MRNTPIGRIGNYRIFEHPADNTFEAVDDFGPVHYLTFQKGHLGGHWRFRPSMGHRFATLFEAIQTLP